MTDKIKIKKTRNLRHNESEIAEEIIEIKQIVTETYLEKMAEFDAYRLKTDARIITLETKITTLEEEMAALKILLNIEEVN